MSQAQPLAPIYAQHLNSKFRYHAEDGQATDFELIRVDLKQSPPDQEQFSLVFRAPHETPPMQNMYRLEHESLGAEELLLVPIEHNRDGILFEAAFYRFLK